MPRPKFDYTLDYPNLNLREQPELYRVGIGEQGVLSVEPYKSEILPHWRFKNPEVAEQSAQKIYRLFLEYKQAKDFVGMDMARKFLQMGYTRARRYANHKSGRKYSDEDKVNPPQNIPTTPPYKTQANRDHHVKKRRKQVLPQAADALTNEKAEAARIFYGYYLQARQDNMYQKWKKEWQEKYG